MDPLENHTDREIKIILNNFDASLEKDFELIDSKTFNWETTRSRIVEKDEKRYIAQLMFSRDEIDILIAVNKAFKNDLCRNHMPVLSFVVEAEIGKKPDLFIFYIAILPFYYKQRFADVYNKKKDVERKLLLKDLVNAMICLHDADITYSNINTHSLSVATFESGPVKRDVILDNLRYAQKEDSPNWNFDTNDNMVPERIGNFSRRTKQTDIWDLGFFLYEMVMRQKLQKGFRHQVERVALIKFEEYDRKYNWSRFVEDKLAKIDDPKFRDLLQNMLRINPAERLTMKQVIKHPYLYTGPLITAKSGAPSMAPPPPRRGPPKPLRRAEGRVFSDDDFDF